MYRTRVCERSESHRTRTKLVPLIYYHDNIVAVIEQNPMDNFLYALKSSESKRQYPKRFEKFLNFLGLQGSLEGKAVNFVMKAQLDIQWADTNFMKFLEFEKSRNLRGETATGTVVNYYRATKLFCEMNDLELSWKKIARVNYGAKWGLATNSKQLKSLAIKRLLDRALWEQGIRQKLAIGVKRHEWKEGHGYRKFFKSHAEQVMGPANVERLMGHDLGVSESYWKPTESEVLQDYLKAVDLLTINGNEQKLSRQVAELQDKSKNSEYIIGGRLVEKDKQIKSLTDKYDSEIQILKEAIFDMQTLLKQPEKLLELASSQGT